MPSKIGPWGGNGGMAHDMKVVPHRMESVTVCSDAVVNSLTFSYNDRNGKQRILGPWGGPAGSSFTVSERNSFLFQPDSCSFLPSSFFLHYFLPVEIHTEAFLREKV